MSSNQQDNRNNNNRRNLNYGRTSNRGPDNNRERSYSDSQPVPQVIPPRTDRPRYNNNNGAGNNNYNNSRNVRASSPDAPQGRPVTANPNYHGEERSNSPPAYNRRRDYVPRSAPGGAPNHGPPGRPAYQTRRDDQPAYQQRNDDRGDRRRGDDRDYNNHNNNRSGGYESSNLFSGKPAPYKQDTNKLPRISSTDFFHLELEDLRAFVANEDEVRIKSYKGELVYKSLILHLLGDRTISSQYRRDLILLRTRYESLFVLSIFLNQGTNFRILFPEFGGRQPDYYGLVVYALLWESAVTRDGKEPNLVNLQPWFNIVRNIKEWIDSHVNFERTFPSVEGKDIVWKSSASSDIKWKESSLHEYEYATPTHEENNNQNQYRGGNRTQGQQGGYQPRQNYGGDESNNKYGGRDQREGGRGGERRQYDKSESYDQGERKPRGERRAPSPDNNKAVTTSGNLNAVKSVTEPKVLPSIAYRNVADLNSKLNQIIAKEAKIYTEKYGNTMNFVPSAQAGHEWNDLRIRSNTIFGQNTNSTWTGAQCVHCDAFLIRAKVDNKTSNLFIFGLTECPNKKSDEWIQGYQKRISQAFASPEYPLKDKFTVAELRDWGFLDQEEEGK